MIQMIVYTDGSAIGNPGPGGWGFVAIQGDLEFHISGHAEYTTNNKMELRAVTEVLSRFTDISVFDIHTDSMYVINCGSGKWRRKKNTDQWASFESARKGRKINWIKVKAHSGDKYNDIADYLANFQGKKIKKILLDK